MSARAGAEPAAGDAPEPAGRGASLLGLAHVATCSFLAARLAPSGHFWLALGGGIALARVGDRHGLRAGYGASLAAIAQTIALIGPARVSGPLTQAFNAPLIGRMQGRGASRAARLAACFAIRLAHYAVTTLLVVLVIVGGTQEFVATYDRLVGWLPLVPTGDTAAVIAVIALSMAAGAGFSVIQVLAYERALGRWPAEGPAAAAPVAHPGERSPRRVSLAIGAVAAAWTILLALPAWPVLGAVTAALVIAWGIGRQFPRDVVRLGAALAAVLALGALFPAIIGAVELDDALRRAIRIALLVLTATWARAAVGAPALRHAARRAFWHVRALPSAREAAAITEDLESDARLGPAARDLGERLRDVPHEVLPVADALTEWVAAEATAYETP
ncbi:MAG TPA: hypothetical protein VM266_00410 [Solirubrobacteraceae bacterium]|nr:hypothetical protein [Solirubrobacteraceae bacterium]